MTKLKKPLLSFGAQGTIANALTFQKRARGHFARQKPIPKDPKSTAQLAQRQIYRDAVDAWHALTPQEKEAWRGVCPGLTAYQCFMQAKIRELLGPPPPPPEYTEEQTQYAFSMYLGLTGLHSGGQRLIIPNRLVSKLGFWLRKRDSPDGTISMEIYRKSDEALLISKLWGNAVDLQPVFTYEEAEFDAPTLIDDEVYIVATASGTNWPNCCQFAFQSPSVKPDENYCDHNDTWGEDESQDTAYRYKYYLP